MARVYVSSTYEDMKECREAILSVLRAQKHQPVGMEDYTAESSRPLDKCLRDVANCDAYVGIFGWRYGFVPKDGNPERLSITELEYRKAKELDLPRLAFLQSKAGIGSLADYVTRENNQGTRIEQFRQALQNELLINQFDAPEDLAVKASNALANAQLQDEDDNEVALRDAALRELKGLGVLILKVYTFQAMFFELNDLYMATRVLRAEDPEGLTAQVLRRAATGSKDRLLSIGGKLLECKAYLSESEAQLNKKQMADLDTCINRLADFAVQDKSGKSDERTMAVDDYTHSISAWLGVLNALSEGAWAELQLSELKPQLDRLRPQVPDNTLDRIDDAFRRIDLPPPLHRKCDLLTRERKLLRSALKDFATLRGELDRLDVDELRLYCKAIKRRVREARECWDLYAKLPGHEEPWENGLLGDGADQWEVIDKCEADMTASLLGALEGGIKSIPAGLVDKLIRGQKFIELHFESVGNGLAMALGAVRNILGKPLMDIESPKEEHAGA
ncbi:MAG: DUF4062 domain-containing protein [Burkholderiales bacterium]